MRPPLPLLNVGRTPLALNLVSIPIGHSYSSFLHIYIPSTFPVLSSSFTYGPFAYCLSFPVQSHPLNSPPLLYCHSTTLFAIPITSITAYPLRSLSVVAPPVLYCLSTPLLSEPVHLHAAPLLPLYSNPLAVLSPPVLYCHSVSLRYRLCLSSPLLPLLLVISKS